MKYNNKLTKLIFTAFMLAYPGATVSDFAMFLRGEL